MADMVIAMLEHILSGDVRRVARASFILDTLAENLRAGGIDVPAMEHGAVSADCAAHVHATASQKEH